MADLQNKVVSHIDLYADLATGSRPSFIYAKQYDAKSRYIIATIKSGHNKIVVKGTARFNVKKPDGTFFYDDCQINDDGTVTIELDSQILSVDGEVSCDISIFDGDIPNQLILTTSTFFIIVEKSNYDLDAIKSSNVYIDLESAKVDAQKAATQAEAAMGVAENSAEAAFEAAKAAQDAADRAELAGGGISAEVDNRLKSLEQWMECNDITASLSVSPSIAEVGEEITEVKLAWNVSKPATSITLDGVSVDGSSHTDMSSYTENKTWELQATATDGGVATAKATLSFLHRVYWGVGTIEDGFDSEFVKSLAQSKLTASKSIMFTVTPNKQYIYYVVPKDLCDTEPVFHIDGGFAGGFGHKSKEEVHIVTNAYGVEIVYYVYRSDHLLVGPTKVDVT